MGDSLDEMVKWAGTDGTNEADLVVLGITDCNDYKDKSCKSAVKALLDARHIVSISDCSQLVGLTASAAFAKAKLPGGGAILAIFDCWSGHYDERVACSGFGSTLGDTAQDTTVSTVAPRGVVPRERVLNADEV